MADVGENDESTPTFRFKRRKIAHPRTRLDSDAALTPVPVSAEASRQAPSPAITDIAPTTSPPLFTDDAEADVPNLKEILKNRKKPRHRVPVDAVARKPEVKSDALAPVSDAPPKQHSYSDRFVAQTGQVVGIDDRQMMDYVEARIAEQNRIKYGWPIPARLVHAVQHLTLNKATSSNSDGRNVSDSTPSSASAITIKKPAPDARMAAGMGKLQEIDLGPEATARNIQLTEQARQRMEGRVEPVVEEHDTIPKRKQRRWQKRRNSEDMRRDMMVEAVLRESKLEYFSEDTPGTNPPLPPTNADDPIDADTAMAEKFRREFLESLESNRNARKPAAPAKGAKDIPKRPKMGGSRSARAAMVQKEKEEKMKGIAGAGRIGSGIKR